MPVNKLKIALALITTILGSSVFGQSRPPKPTARDYFNEIYTAGGLDNFADGYVCFDDDPELETFFIFGKSEIYVAYLKAEGQWGKLSNQDRDQFNTPFLVVRSYDNGVPSSDREFYTQEDSSWIIDGVKERIRIGKNPIKLRLTISWQTWRYKKTVEIYNPNFTFKKAISRYGKCEEVKPDVRQTGGNQ